MIAEINRFDHIFQVETYTREEKGKSLSFITHKSLEKLFYDIKEIRPSLTYTSRMIMINEKRVVFEGQIADGEQIYLPKIGESCADTLHGEIAKDYPVLIAHQRAFDRAFISYLNLEDKMYSDIEIINTENGEKEASENIPRPAIFKDEYVPQSMKREEHINGGKVTDEDQLYKECEAAGLSKEDVDFLICFESTDIPVDGYGKVKETPAQALYWFANAMTDSEFGIDLRRYIELKKKFSQVISQ